MSEAIVDKTVDLRELVGAEIHEYSVPMPATHRCDACGAQAYVEVQMPSKTVLLFCVHHYTKSKDALREKAARIADHTPALHAQEAAFKGVNER